MRRARGEARGLSSFSCVLHLLICSVCSTQPKWAGGAMGTSPWNKNVRSSVLNGSIKTKFSKKMDFKSILFL